MTDPDAPGGAASKPPDASSVVPFFVLNDLSVHAAGLGSVECRSAVLPWLDGTPELGIHAGVAGLMDIVLSYAASTSASAIEMFVSLGMRIQHWELPPLVGTALIGCASVQTAHGGTVLTEGRITANGVTVGSGTLQSMSVPRIAVASVVGAGRPRATGVPPPQDTESAGLVHASPDLLRGPTNAGPLSEVLQLPVSTMCSLRVEGASRDQIALSIVPPPSFERTGGVVHGGAVPILGQLACAALIAATVDPDREARRTEVAVDYLRPAFVGRSYTLTAALVHQSRRVMIIAGDVLDETGRITSRYTETSVLRDRSNEPC